MANEFWNVVVTAIVFFIGGMAIHSALGHSYGDLLIRWFHSIRKKAISYTKNLLDEKDESS